MPRTKGPGSIPALAVFVVLCMIALPTLAAASTTETIDSSRYVTKELTEPSMALCLTPLERGTEVEAKLRLEVVPKDVGGEQLKVHLAGNVNVPMERLQQETAGTAGTSLLHYEFAIIDQKVTLKVTLNNEELPYTPFDMYIGRYEFHLVKFYIKGHVKVTYDCTDPLSGELIHGPRAFMSITTTATTTATNPPTTTTTTPNPYFTTTTPTTTTTTTTLHPPFTTTTLTTLNPLFPTTTTITPNLPFTTTTPTKTTTTSTPAATTTTTPTTTTATTTTTTTTTISASTASNPPTTTTLPGWIWDLGAVGPVPTLAIVVLAVLVVLVVAVVATILWCCRNRRMRNDTSSLVEGHSSNNTENQWKNINVFETREDHSPKNIFETGERYPSKDNLDEEHPLMRNCDNEKQQSLNNPRCMAYNRETSFYP